MNCRQKAFSKKQLKVIEAKRNWNWDWVNNIKIQHDAHVIEWKNQ